MKLNTEGWYGVQGVGIMAKRPEEEGVEPDVDEATQEELEELAEDLEDEPEKEDDTA